MADTENALIPGQGIVRPPMIYTNLLYFLVAIFLFSAAAPGSRPWLPALPTLAAILALLLAFSLVAGRLFGRCRIGSVRQYFQAEKRLSLLALLLFGFMVYGLDLKYWLHPLSLDDRLPVLENLAGLAVFFLVLAVMWNRARPAYEALFGQRHSRTGFLTAQVRVNLPIVLPWLVLSLVFDLLGLLPWPSFQELLRSPWGDLLLFALFVSFLAVFFPPLVRRLWNCRPMEPGPLREHILAFCRKLGVRVEVYYWPLFGGQVLTAGIMGLVPGLRYLLITPALLAALDRNELDAVLAHEIGHVRRRHLVLYILLFLGFSLLASSLAEPLPRLVLASDLFYRTVDLLSLSPDTLMAILAGGSLLLFMLLYFRFLFGWFIRNFERQADLFVFPVQGTAGPLIRAFEKIAWLSGGTRNEKSWHHYGIGERIDFLQRCEQEPVLVRRHDRKLALALGLYFVLVGVSALGLRGNWIDSDTGAYEVRYAEAVLLHKAEQEPGNSLWLLLLGDLMQKEAMEQKAISAYERALALDPMNATINNNLAWLLLTARNRELRDPVRALTLARTAVLLREEGYILDTLATAYWANGLVQEALATELKALRLDPGNGQYYRRRLQIFSRQRWDGGEGQGSGRL